MRFTVLIPTRDGGHLLETSLRSALDQGHDDLEVVVADNANTDGTQEILEKFRDDPRLRVVRSERKLTHAQNWQRALDHSSGDYVVLLQDDELLLPGYFETCEGLLREFNDPDCLSCSGYYFLWPEAANSTFGQYRDPAYPDHPLTGELELTPEIRHATLKRMFGGLGFDFGVPHQIRTLMSRQAIDRLPVDLFAPPFPDLSAQVSLLVTAGPWYVVPAKLVVIGAAEKSFWTMYFGGDREAGARHLGIDGVEAELPGDAGLNGVVAGLRRMKDAYPAELAAYEPNRGVYVARQGLRWLREVRDGSIDRAEFRRRLRLLSAGDLARAALTLPTRELLSLIRAVLRRGPLVDELRRRGFQSTPGVTDIGEFAAWLEDCRPAPAGERLSA
jgi:glycosyltransferase involved in cell wall biosynthesis